MFFLYLYVMKYLTLFISILTFTSLTSVTSAQQTVSKKDSSKITFASVGIQPEYPGGANSFLKYIQKNLKYPEVARLLGISGKELVTFVVDKNGMITEATPFRCLGAGCESEAVRVISSSKPWKPGLLDGKPVRVQYTVPISFDILVDKVYFKDLARSDHGFVFEIEDKTYTLEEAKTLLGKYFSPRQIETADIYYQNEKYKMPDKSDVYLVRLKKQMDEK